METTTANAAPPGIAAAIAAGLAALGLPPTSFTDEVKDFPFGEVHLSTTVAVLVAASGAWVMAREGGQVKTWPERGHGEIGALAEDIRLAEAHEFRRRGAPPKLIGGKAQPLYLDDESTAIADRLGNGNRSAGVRHALLLARDAPPLERAGAEQGGKIGR
jgi:hypothetical protein